MFGVFFGTDTNSNCTTVQNQGCDCKMPLNSLCSLEMSISVTAFISLYVTDGRREVFLVSLTLIILGL